MVFHFIFTHHWPGTISSDLNTSFYLIFPATYWILNCCYIFIVAVYRQGHWSLEKLSDLPKITELIGCKSGRTQAPRAARSICQPSFPNSSKQYSCVWPGPTQARALSLSISQPGPSPLPRSWAVPIWEGTPVWEWTFQSPQRPTWPILGENHFKTVLLKTFKELWEATTWIFSLEMLLNVSKKYDQSHQRVEYLRVCSHCKRCVHISWHLQSERNLY